MGNIFGFFSLVFSETETFIKLIGERISEGLQNLNHFESIIVYTVTFSMILVFFFVIVLIFRLYYNHQLKRLHNIPTEFQINVNRFYGEKCNLFYEIILFQKMTILDDMIVNDYKDVKVEVSKLDKDKKDTLGSETSTPFILDRSRLFKRVLISTISILIVFITVLFSKYKDFDIVFESLYNLRYREYIFISNITSLVFVFGFIVSTLMTAIVWIYLYGKEEWKHKIEVKWLYETFDFVFIIPIFIAALTFMNGFIVSPAAVTKTSMEPNYYEGDTVFLLHANNYDRFDVVIVLVQEGRFYPEYGFSTRSEYNIKRIIGLPGDTILIENGLLYINGNRLDESDYLTDSVRTYCMNDGTFSISESCTFVIPQGEYFLLGDNRIVSHDSRSIGTFKKNQIYGRVFFKIG